MLVTYVIVAVLAIIGYELFRLLFSNAETNTAEGLIRASIVIGLLLAAIPIGFFLSSVTISALAENIITGSIVAAASISILLMAGVGLYIVAANEIPAFFDGVL